MKSAVFVLGDLELIWNNMDPGPFKTEYSRKVLKWTSDAILLSWLFILNQFPSF